MQLTQSFLNMAFYDALEHIREHHNSSEYHKKNFYNITINWKFTIITILIMMNIHDYTVNNYVDKRYYYCVILIKNMII